MNGRLSRSWAPVLIAGSLLLAAPAQAQPDRYDGNGWSFTPPDGWVALEEPYLNAMNELLQRVTDGDDQTYIAGFADPSLWPVGEYVLVQLNNNAFSHFTEREMVEGFGGLSAEAGPISERLTEGSGGMIRDVRVGSAVYDPDRRRILIRSESLVDGQPIQGFSVLYPGESRGIQLNWFAPKGEFDASVPMFAASSDSFAWDDGEAWKPAMGGGTRVLVFAVIGGVAAGVVPLIGGVVNKRRRNQGATANG